MTRIPYAGAVVSVLLVALLLTPPGELVDREGAYASQRADVFDESAVPVELADGLRSDPGEVIPKQLGDWNGTDDDSWDTETLDRNLAYDHLLVRDYEAPGLYYPVQLMVLTARHDQAFHDPEVCFDVQGGMVQALEDVSMQAPGPAEAETMNVGQLHISYADEADNGTGGPPKLVHNLFVVERHDAAPDRTTWIRLSIPGVAQDDVDQVAPVLTGLMEQVTPYLFHATGEDRTVGHWVNASHGTPALAGAVVLAVAPVLGHGAWLWRTEPEGDPP